MGIHWNIKSLSTPIEEPRKVGSLIYSVNHSFKDLYRYRGNVIQFIQLSYPLHELKKFIDIKVILVYE